MRTIRACAFALSLAPALYAADGVTLQHRPLQAGDVYKVTSGGFINMKMTASMGGRVSAPRDMGMRSAETFRVEVLEADGMGPTRLRVRYLQSEIDAPGNQEQFRKRAEAVAGKTFLVTASAEGPRVTDEKGRPVDAGAAKQVADDTLRVREDPFCRAMAGRPVALGETLDIAPEVAHSLLGNTENTEEIEHISLKLREVTTLRGAPAAIFEVQVAMRSDMEDGSSMSVRAAGLATLSVNECLPLSVEISGPMTMAGRSEEQGRTMDIRGSGQMRFVIRNEYGR